MMKYLLMFVATVAIASAQPRMDFGLIGGGSSGSYYEGGDMTITCTDQPSSVGSLLSLSLFRLRGLEVTETVVFKMHVDPWTGTEPIETWGITTDRSRYLVDQKSLTKFRITIQNLECIDDTAQYWCLAEGTGTTSRMESSRQNLYIAAAPKAMRMETYEQCRDISFGDNQVNCLQSGCQSIARYGEAPTFVCAVSVSGENARQYRFTWYRKKPMVEDVFISERNVTQPTIDSSRNYRDCEMVTIRSTLTYGTRADDHNLELECRLTDTRGDQYGVYNTSVKVCVTGLPGSITAVNAGATFPSTIQHRTTIAVNAGATSPSTIQHRTTIAVNAGATTWSHLVAVCTFMPALLTLSLK